MLSHFADDIVSLLYRAVAVASQRVAGGPQWRLQGRDDEGQFTGIGGSAFSYAERLARLTAGWESGVRERKPLSGGKMGDVWLVTFNNGDRGILKHARLNPKLKDLTPKEQSDHEVMAALVGDAIDVPVPAVMRVDEETVLKEYAEGEIADVYFDDPHQLRGLLEENREAARRLGLLTVLIHNGDQHPGNLVVQDDGQGHRVFRPIDFGNAFPGATRREGELFPLETYQTDELTDPFTARLNWRGEPERVFHSDGLTVEEAQEVTSRLLALKGDFSAMRQDIQYRLMIERAQMILSDAKSKARRVARQAAA